MTNQATLRGPYKPDDILVDRYVVTCVQRITGLTALYQAHDRQSADTDGLYVIKEELVQGDNQGEIQRQIDEFRQKAELLITLDHSAIPRIYQGFVIDGRTYLVMDYVDGKDMEDILYETEGYFAVKTVYNWALELCDVLHYLHTRKPHPIVYRDLKPANIMIDPKNRVRLVDYSIAGVFEEDKIYPPLGTDGYAAPEQYQGRITPLIDMYALGATLHHLLTRYDPRLEPPFSFGARLIRKINPAVPWPFNAIVMRALAYEPSERFASMAEMRAALRKIKGQIV
jgi:serine/threonine protein kinase